MTLAEHRDRLYAWLRQCLIGEGEALIGIKPLDRYQTGILFPILRGEFGIDPARDESDAGDHIDEGDGDAGEAAHQVLGISPRKQRFVPPSSVGFSFFVVGEKIRLQLVPRARRYFLTGASDEHGITRDQQGRFANNWESDDLGGDESVAYEFVAPDDRRFLRTSFDVFSDGNNALAELLLIWRPLARGWLVTASLSNTQLLMPSNQGEKESRERNTMALFDVGLECIIDAGVVGPYPGVSFDQLSDEDQELELRYRNHRVYAIGHGAAVDRIACSNRRHCASNCGAD
ncbi:hypothetical protein Thiowin_04835 [Thiorhodovibrio winogradskyi]|uniref:Uncharacterized protein n=1 Tax=Thiorhodovibrio winogradskyi TaxID=77007 RepID=A0ABZ0SHE5_9GAMM|nr:hypothetical protein [Thiorhodovibrio winogradskyi]